MKNYDFAHLQKMVLTEHRVKRIYEQAIDDFMRIYDWMEQPQDEMETLRFDKQPILRPHVAKIMQRLQRGGNVVVTDGIKASWMLSQEKNDALVRKAAKGGWLSSKSEASPTAGAKKGLRPSPQQLKAFFTRSEEGLQAFLSRKVAGLNFSERVWKLTDGFKEEMEMAIELGMREGRSADDLSRDIRQYLQQPDMLFRRIRDKSTGMFRLSKRAAAYHPGRGVYRSSYKNARRLAGTEMNMAYRTADHERWQQLDFVVGFEVRLSNNHTELNRQGKAVRFHDMCDELQGRYPKTFKFVGWHPHCRCFAVPILKTEEEMTKDTERILSGKEPSEESANTVQEMPKGFEDWIKKKEDKLALAVEGKLQMPLFIKDNFVEGNPEKGYVWEEKKPLSPLEKAKLRHEARTPEQEEDIRKRWEERKAYHKEVKDAANTSLNAAEEYSEVDTSALKEALKSGQIVRIKEETARMNAAVEEAREAAERRAAEEAKKREEEKDPMAKVIPNLEKWKGVYSEPQIKSFYSHIQKKIAELEEMPLPEQLAELESLSTDKQGTYNYKYTPMEREVWKAHMDKVERLKNQTIADAKVDALSLVDTNDSEFKARLKAAISAKEKGQTAKALKEIEEAEKIKAEIDRAALKDATRKKPYIPINTDVQWEHEAKYGEFSAEQKVESLEHLVGGDKKRAQDLYEGVKSFSYQWDYEIRAYQSGKLGKDYVPREAGHTYEAIKKRAEHLEEFILRSPKWVGGTTYRGLCMTEEAADALVARLKSKEGADMLGTSSWSTEKGISKGFAYDGIGFATDEGEMKNAAVLISSKRQKRATSIKHLSNIFNEDEVLSSKENRYRIVNVEKYYDCDCFVYYIEVEPI